MTEQEKIVVVRGAINSTDALCLVSTLTGDMNATLEAEILYPYFCFDAGCSVPTLVGRKDISVICLVDAVNGLGATADNFALKREAVSPERLLPVELGHHAAADIAERTVTHRMGKKLRVITSFDVSMSQRGIVYKRFWIVQSTEARVMVDSTTGNLHPLNLRAA
jgi:hypothetical protein